MSEAAGAAMLEASGLKPTGTFQVYRIWWMPKRGAPIWAADFLVGDDGLGTAAHREVFERAGRGGSWLRLSRMAWRSKTRPE